MYKLYVGDMYMTKKKKQTRLNFIVSEEEKDKLFDIASEKGFHTFSDFCRIILLNSRDISMKLVQNTNIININTLTISSNKI